VGNLIVSARVSDQKRIESMIKQLGEGREMPVRETRIYPFEDSAELTKVFPLLDQLYKEKHQGRETTDPADATIVHDSSRTITNLPPPEF